MCGVLRAQPLWAETFTRLRMRQFERLLKAVRERGGNGPGGGRPWCLPPADRVLLVAVYYRTNLTMRKLAPDGEGLAECPVCGATWVVGVDRRSNAVYCSRRCVTRAWTARKDSYGERSR